MANASRWDVHPSVTMVQKWIEELPAKTGRALEEWLVFIRRDGPGDEKGARGWLKEQHGLGTNTALWLAERAYRSGPGINDEDPESYLAGAAQMVADQYAGPKAGLVPIFDAVVAFARALGSDVKISPCQTIVPLYRHHVFGQLKPSTRTRLDLGLAIKKHGGALAERLIDTGGLAKNDRITHRIPLATLDDFDDHARSWLRRAYQLDG